MKRRGPRVSSDSDKRDEVLVMSRYTNCIACGMSHHQPIWGLPISDEFISFRCPFNKKLLIFDEYAGSIMLDSEFEEWRNTDSFRNRNANISSD
jgi:hypothetical protein